MITFEQSEYAVNSDANDVISTIGYIKKDLQGYYYSPCGNYSLSAKTLQQIADKLESLNDT